VNAVILVPVKEHSRAKSRLSPLLTPHERGAIAWAMFKDLIRALSPLPYPVALVTNSSRAAARVEMLGWRVLWEEEQVSESASIDAASRLLAAEGADAVLRLPADLPLIQSRDIAEILSLPITTPSTVLAPSWDRMGTNALLRTPPGLFPSHFGPDSFALHVREASDRGIPFRVVENPRLALDLDDVSDIVRFLAQPADGETYRTLMKLDIQERLAHHAIQGDPHLGPARNS
jgi:2-phospho-L-lactate guanylyltransferase